MGLENTLLIGLGTKARAGKDTVAATIAEAYKDRFDIKVYGFADFLKQEVDLIGPAKIAFTAGIPLDTNPDMSDPFCRTEWGKQPRVLQWYGAEKRKQDTFHWVKKLRARIEADQPQVAIVKDVRHFNELFFVKAFGGWTVKVTRQGFVDLSRDPNHPSEIELDGAPFDIEITVQDGQLEQLKKDALVVFELILAQNRPVDQVADEGNTSTLEDAREPLVALS
jgi:hypothetical protein